VIAVDGKTLRGSGHGDQDSRHLLAALDHAHGVVLGQVEVGAKTNEIPLFTTLLDRIDITGAVITADALHAQREHATYLAGRGAHYLLIVKRNQCATRRFGTSPPQAGQTRREVCWVRWLTWIRKVKGTRACQQTGGRAEVPGTACRGTRAVWRKLDCLNPNLQRQQFTAAGTAPVTGARRGRGVLVRPGHPSRRERCPARAFKEMSGAPGPRCDVCRRRTWDHRPSPAGGDGVPVVAAGVTPGRGGQESCPQGEGAQVMRRPGDGGGMRNAKR
jgi:Transposase DDE domain